MRLFLDPAKLQRVPDEHRTASASATPFPHAVIDGAFPDAMLDRVIAAFPTPGSRVWKEYDDEGLEEDRFAPPTRSERAKRVVRSWAPPVLVDRARRLGHRT